MFTLWDRMKEYYENVSRTYLTRRTPVILRLDGKAFHTFTRNFEKPYDRNLIEFMNYTALEVIKDIQGAKCAYVQSDEISILITDYDTLETEAWFDYNVQKMTSISSALSSVAFSKRYLKFLFENNKIDVKDILKHNAYFDARVFNIPKDDVVNYFIWRQKDWERNSLQMLARSLYSAKQLHGKKRDELHELIFEKWENWANQKDDEKNWRFISRDEQGKWIVFETCPIFTENKENIEKFL